MTIWKGWVTPARRAVTTAAQMSSRNRNGSPPVKANRSTAGSRPNPMRQSAIMSRLIRPGPTTSRLLQQKSHFSGHAWLSTKVSIARSRIWISRRAHPGAKNRLGRPRAKYTIPRRFPDCATSGSPRMD